MVQRLIPGVFLTLIGILCISMLAEAKTGRWKVDSSGSCTFDANDDGPDQCSAQATPAAGSGRWKVDGSGACVFDTSDSGPNQCSSQAAGGGRWKLDGNGGCVFDSSDSGPNQCSPQAPTESELTAYETEHH